VGLKNSRVAPLPVPPDTFTIERRTTANDICYEVTDDHGWRVLYFIAAAGPWGREDPGLEAVRSAAMLVLPQNSILTIFERNES